MGCLKDFWKDGFQMDGYFLQTMQLVLISMMGHRNQDQGNHEVFF